MKKGIVWEIVLVCILGVAGWNLFGIMESEKSNNPELKAIEVNNNLVFSDGVGIDFMGNNIDSILKDKTDEAERFVVAFLLRYDSMDADLKFWNEVNNYLSEFDTVRLIAYCENDKCIETLKVNPDTAHFYVLEYGEVKDMQAIIIADATGDFWFRGKEAKKINWRNDIMTPYDIAVSIKRGI